MYSWDDNGPGLSRPSSSTSRSYSTARVVKNRSDLQHTYKDEFLKTHSPYPLVVGIDTTGSMEEWPEIFFEKLPLLYKEAMKYFPGIEISFQAINDYEADGHDVALQPTPFGRHEMLDKHIGELYPVGGGGGQVMESYEMFAAYNLFMETPEAKIKPIVIILGDEAPFPQLPPNVAKFYGLTTRNQDVPSEKIFDLLQKKCNVYLIRKPYDGQDKEIVDIWKNIGHMNPEKISTIKDPRRVVDVILGILSIIAGKIDMFQQELASRQESHQIIEVNAALKNITGEK